MPAEHPHLILTGQYNVLEKLRASTAPDALDPADRCIDDLDTAVAVAYGWPADLSDNDILARLVALNQERAKEEAAGQVRWLRPDYKIPRFGGAKDKLALTGSAMNQRRDYRHWPGRRPVPPRRTCMLNAPAPTLCARTNAQVSGTFSGLDALPAGLHLLQRQFPQAVCPGFGIGFHSIEST